MPIGAHMSISGGISLAPGRAAEAGCEALQVFTRSNVRWSFPPLADSEAHAFRDNVRRLNLQPVIAHGCYLVNLCSADAAIRRKSASTLADEIRRCARLGIGDIVIHPGSHPAGIDTATRMIAAALSGVLDRTAGCPVRVLLETTAGQGSQVGSTFEQLRALLDIATPTARLGVCVDTCHIFAAGYDIRTAPAWRDTTARLDAVIGIGRVGAFHLNDSKRELGSRVDRHEQIGRGTIGVEAFRLLFNDARFRRLPQIIETPKEDFERTDWDAVNIALLKSLRRKA